MGDSPIIGDSIHMHVCLHCHLQYCYNYNNIIIICNQYILLSGSGGYADNASGAISTTGHGESLMTACVAKHAAILMEQGTKGWSQKYHRFLKV